MMSFDGTTLWAVAVTAIALVLGGMHIERWANASASAAVPMSAEATEPGAGFDSDPYQMPAWLHEAPKEWRSVYEGTREGYAVLFDYERRLLLIEHCTHPGFFDANTNRPIESSAPYCERLLTAEMLEFTDNGVIVQNRSGQTVEVETLPKNEIDSATLQLRLDQHSMTLIPGQTNDLITDMANTPNILAEYQLFFEYQQQAMKQKRAEMSAGLQDSLPRFTVSAAAMKANEEVRDKDRAANAN